MKHTKLQIVPLALAALGGSLRAQGETQLLDGGSRAVASIGDLDGDGRREALVSVYPAQPGPAVRLCRVADGSLLRSHAAPGNVDYGAALLGLNDLDGDGVGDYAISAPAADWGLPSFVEFRSGASGALLASFAPPGVDESFGHALANVGDVDLDGVDDLLISARTRMQGVPSRVLLVSGASRAVLRAHVAGPNNSYFYGRALALLGDIDGDGRADYAITDDGSADPATLPTVEVFSAASGALLYTVTSLAFDGAGRSLVGLGRDLDGDGVEDFAVGVPGRFHAPFRTGAVDVRSGASGALLHSIDAGYGVMFGEALAAPGDLDGDGVPEIVSLVPAVWTNGFLANLGYAHIFKASSGLELGRFAHRFTGPLATAGDVNFDGAGDLLVGGGPAASSSVTLVVLGGVPAPRPYCMQPPNSLGCVSIARVAGSASLSIGPDLELAASSLRPQRPGLFFWSFGQTATPFGSGTMCADAPRVRLPLSNTGGSTGCSGELRTTLSRTYLAANGLLPGSVFFAQAWARDNSSPSQPTQLSSALEVTLWP